MATLAPSASRVFVSHSHQDNAYCREFVAGLRARGYAVWYDEHNLGWGALRPTIEKELPRCAHFIAILSPAAVASEWVNTEIDAALDLLGKRLLHTFTFVVATSCEVPLLLRRWKRIEGPNGTAVGESEAVARAAAILAAPADDAQMPAAGPTPQPHMPPPQQPTLPERPGPAPMPAGATPAYHLTPMSLYSLGFRGWNVKGVECILPPICPVPGGVFTMGSDKTQDREAKDSETARYPVLVGDFSIGQHPVTVAEYACAVRDKAVRVPPEGYLGRTWEKQLQRLEHPVVCVSWHDAVAYVTWLAKVSGQFWWLPTEAEWEKMARWDVKAGHARRYPWSDAFDKTMCNTRESSIGTTTPVGRYPGGASPYGAQDVAGNVWEWTSSLYMPYAYNQNDGREDRNSAEKRVLRGGSWYGVARSARATFRSRGGADDLGGSIGFRIAVAAPGRAGS